METSKTELKQIIKEELQKELLKEASLSISLPVDQETGRSYPISKADENYYSKLVTVGVHQAKKAMPANWSDEERVWREIMPRIQDTVQKELTKLVAAAFAAGPWPGFRQRSSNPAADSIGLRAAVDIGKKAAQMVIQKHGDDVGVAKGARPDRAALLLKRQEELAAKKAKLAALQGK